MVSVRNDLLSLGSKDDFQVVLVIIGVLGMWAGVFVVGGVSIFSLTSLLL